MTAELQIFCRLYQQKNCENRPIFDEVMCTAFGVHFFGPTRYSWQKRRCRFISWHIYNVDGKSLVISCSEWLWANLYL